MQFLILFTTILAVAWADGYVYPVPARQLQTPIVIIGSTQQQQQQSQLQQYFTQDSLGQYSYGYSEPLSSKQEVRTSDGVTRGTYSYIDAHGLLQTVDYTADAGGFHVAATNLPIATQEAVAETPEVALARQQHLDAHEAILKGDIASSSILPQPVQDTAEVAAAKKDFFARYAMEEQKQRSLQKTALLKSQGLAPSSPAHQSILPGVRSSSLIHSALKHQTRTASVKTPSATVKYGYQYGIPVQPQRFYLPLL